MLEEEESVNDSNKVLIEETLINIWRITLKIKRELDTINDLVKEKGSFDSAITFTNQNLLQMIKEKNIDLSKIEEEDEKDEDGNIINRESESGSDIVNPLVSIINRFSKI